MKQSRSVIKLQMNNNNRYKEGAKLLSNTSDPQNKRQVLRIYIVPALISMSQIQSGEEMIKLMRPYWSQFKALDEVSLKVKFFIRFYSQNSQQEAIALMTAINILAKKLDYPEPSLRANPAIKEINLYLNHIGNQGCQLLVKGCWPNLSKLLLKNNNIGSLGCKFLAKGNWPDLCQLDLRSNKIEDQGCQCLIKGNWPNLQMLRLDYNNIRDEGCQFFVKSNWPNLKRIYLNKNKITDMGCQLLIKINFWLQLWGNRIINKTKLQRLFMYRKNVNYASLFQ